MNNLFVKIFFFFIFLFTGFTIVLSKMHQNQSTIKYTNENFTNSSNFTILDANLETDYFKTGREVVYDDIFIANKTNNIENHNFTDMNEIKSIFETEEKILPSFYNNICNPSAYVQVNTSTLIERFSELNGEKIGNKCELDEMALNEHDKERIDAIRTDLENVLSTKADLIENFGIYSYFTDNFNISNYFVNNKIDESVDNKIFFKYLSTGSNNNTKPQERIDFSFYDKSSNFEDFWNVLRKVKWIFDNRSLFNETVKSFKFLDKSIEIISKMKTGKCLLHNLVEKNGCLNFENYIIKDCHLNAMDETLKEIFLDCDLNFDISNNDNNNNFGLLDPLNFPIFINNMKNICQKANINFNQPLKISYIAPYNETTDFDLIGQNSVINLFHQESSFFLKQNLYFLGHYCDFVFGGKKSAEKNSTVFTDQGNLNGTTYSKESLAVINILKLDIRRIYRASKQITGIFENLFDTQFVEMPFNFKRNRLSFFNYKKAFLRKIFIEDNPDIAMDAYLVFLKIIRIYETINEKMTKLSIKSYKNSYRDASIANFDAIEYFLKNGARSIVKEEELKKFLPDICNNNQNNTFTQVSSEISDNFSKIQLIFEGLWNDYRIVNLLKRDNARKIRKEFCNWLIKT